jgi:hypothetical protein
VESNPTLPVISVVDDTEMRNNNQLWEERHTQNHDEVPHDPDQGQDSASGTNTSSTDSNIEGFMDKSLKEDLMRGHVLRNLSPSATAPRYEAMYVGTQSRKYIK